MVEPMDKAMAKPEAVKRTRETEGNGDLSENSAPKRVKIDASGDESKGKESGPAALQAAPNGTAPSTVDIKMKEGSASHPPAAAAAAASSDEDPPVTIMYKTFHTAVDCQNYYSRLLGHIRTNQDLNEYEHNMVLALLAKGHPDPPRKVGPGISAFQVREVTFDKQTTHAFFLVRTDGTSDDFSVRKCIVKLFPKSGKLQMQQQNKPKGQATAQRGRGRGRGPGRGPGRGGPGRGRSGASARGRRGGRRGRF